jgi:hypothetical protein
MSGPTDPHAPQTEATPYRSTSPRTRRRRMVLAILAVAVLFAAGVSLHLTGVLPPQ